MVSNRSEELAQAVAALRDEYPHLSFYEFCKDLTEPYAADAVLGFCRMRRLIVEVLVNNAGIFAFSELREQSSSLIDGFIALHVSAVTRLCRNFADEMALRGHGYILNMASMACWLPMPGLALYAATKAYIRTFSRCLHLELCETGVSVTVCCPGGIATDLYGLSSRLQRLGVRIGVLWSPSRFARHAVDAMLRHRQQYIGAFINRVAILAVSILPARVRLVARHRLLHRHG